MILSSIAIPGPSVEVRSRLGHDPAKREPFGFGSITPMDLQSA
jgi:hypothetical protein